MSLHLRKAVRRSSQVHELKVLGHGLEGLDVGLRASPDESLHHALLGVHEKRQLVQGPLDVRRVLEVVHLQAIAQSARSTIEMYSRESEPGRCWYRFPTN